LLEAGIGIWALVMLMKDEAKGLFGGAGNVAVPVMPTAQASPASEPQKLVSAPAIGLMVASGLNLLLVVGSVVVLAFLLMLTHRTTFYPTPEFQGGIKVIGISILFPVVALLFIGAPSLLTFVGAWRMRKLKGYGLAMTAAVLGILTPPGMFIGAIFGIWAIIVLARADVRGAFDQGRPTPAGKGCLIAFLCFAGIVILAILSIVGLRIAGVSVSAMRPGDLTRPSDLPRLREAFPLMTR